MTGHGTGIGSGVRDNITLMPIPSTTAPPTRKFLAEDVTEKLLADIISGRLAPGAKVSEQELAEKYEVSRSPVREAVDWMATIGLVRQQPRSGTRITEVDPRTITDAVEALLPLLVESLHIVVEVANDRDRRSLITRVEQQGVDGLGLVRPDGLFEQILVVLGNDRALSLFRDLVPHVRRAWTLVPGSVPAGFGGDAAVALRRAISDHDADAAAAVLRDWFEGAMG